MGGDQTSGEGTVPPDAGRLPEPVIQAAIGWAMRLHYRQPEPRDHEEFERWLHADSAHVLAWQRMTELHGFGSDLGTLPPRWAHDTLRAAQNLRDGRAGGRRSAIKLLGWGGMAVASGWLVREHLPWQRVLADFSTGINQQRTVHLDDGSVVVLNTDSAISVDFSQAFRRITLRRGEILVTTGADAEAAATRGGKRPLWVETPFGRMQALGTRFTVRTDGGRVRVSVQEGAVALHPAGGGASVEVPSGESRWLMPGGTAPVEQRGFGPDDWVDGVIAGKNLRLQDLLAEMARYRLGHIACDPRVADLPVSGTFHVGDTDRTLQFLVQTQPITVTYRTRWWITVGPVPGR
jgi:transmembrane sensor